MAADCPTDQAPGARALPAGRPTGRRGTWLTLLAVLALTLCLTLPAQAQPPADAAALEYLRMAARFAMLEEDYPVALRAVEQALALDPDHAELIQLKLQILCEMDRQDQALDYLRSLWARDRVRFAYLRFEAGYIRQKQKLYEKALVHFRHAEEVDRPRAIMEQARVYVQMKDYDKALAAARRLDQQTAAVWQLTAEVYFEKKDYAQARQAVESGLAAAPDPALAQALAELRRNIAANERAERPWRAGATLMAQYEDNVFRDPLQSNPFAQPTRKKGDFSWLAKVDLDYRLGRVENASWGLTTQLQTLQYAQLRDANYSSWSVGAYWERQEKDWGLRLPYDFGYFWAKGDLIRKVMVNSLLPTLRLQHDDHWRTDVFGVLQHKNYLQGEPNVLGWRLGATHFLAKDPSLAAHARLSYAVSQDLASDDKSGFMSGEVTLGGGLPLGGPLSLDLAATYVRYFYDRRVDPFLPLGGEVERRDDQYRAAAQLFYRDPRGWQLVLGYFHTFNNSDIRIAPDFEPYDFKRNVVSLMLNWGF